MAEKRIKLQNWWRTRILKQQFMALTAQGAVLVRDLTLQGETCPVQIDAVLVSEVGLFVIQFAKQRGVITGSDWKRMWGQRRFGRFVHFSSPIYAQHAQVVAVERATGVSHLSVFPLVLFPKSARLRVYCQHHVLHDHDVAQLVRTYEQKIFTPAQVSAFVTQLQAGGVPKDVRARYPQAQANWQRYSEAQREHGICPNCGSVLMIRKTLAHEYQVCSRTVSCAYVAKR